MYMCMIIIHVDVHTVIIFVHDVFIHIHCTSMLFSLQLFSLCSSLDVVLSPSADLLLKGYYLASRRARGTSSNSFTDTPKSAMDTL